MVKIQEIFKAALSVVFKESWGTQTKLGKITGFTPQKINKFLTGEMKNGLEDDRRLIAAALGYNYDQFLNLGRRALGIPVMQKEDPPPAWVLAILPRLRECDPDEIRMIKSLLVAFDLAKEKKI